MLKYFDKAIVMQEIPDEISLALNITNCPHRCKNCHSPYLREDIGTELTFKSLDEILRNKIYKNVTCILFMGGDSSHEDIIYLTNYIHNTYDYKVAMYSGDDMIDYNLLNCLDYYKYGSYQEDKGPINKETTNQILLKIKNNKIEDITNKFQKNFDF